MPDPNELTRPIALVTGASGGIGQALASRLAARGYDLVLVARREERLRELAASLARSHTVQCEIVVADLAKHEERERIIRDLEPHRDRVEILINNAGFGTHGYFRETDLDRELELIAVNCDAPVHLAKRILPWLLARRRGFILNVGSVASFTPGPVMALYYASKSFLLSFSEALWEECRGSGVAVTALCPGPVRTGFQEAAGVVSTARSSIASPMSADDVAASGLAAMFAGRRVDIPGAANRLSVSLMRWLPRTLALGTVRRFQEERRRQTRRAIGLPED